ncbi:MAG TPA: proline racemase family protein [Baekduia sp.]
MDCRTVDYHTAGEPFRIVLDGVPPIGGADVRIKRETARTTKEIDAVRRFLCHEPRGHADMYGCFVVEADDDGADFGALFWHKDGFSTACGHGTIALGRWAVDTGRVAGPDVTIDVPSGRVVATVGDDDVAFLNVPSYVLARDAPAGEVRADVAYGGAIYAFVPAASFGLTVTLDDLPALIAAGRDVKSALQGTGVARHPTDDRLSGIYGTVLYENAPDGDGERNVTIFADGEVDRSPCGSATSARTALLMPSGPWRNTSIIGTSFTARVVEDTAMGVVTEVRGNAYKTGEHHFTLDPRDPLGTGFVLR